MQEAIDKRDDAAVDSQMTLIDNEFEKIAFDTNPSIAANRAKYAQEIAAKAAADAKAAEAKLLAAADAKIATDMKAFKFKRHASYSSDPVFGRNVIANSKITTQYIVFKSSGDSFHVTFGDIFDKYSIPDIISQTELDNWANNSLIFWQNQLTFAVWYATSGCGIAYEDQM